MDVTFLGKALGTASGWDGDPGDCWWVYNFKPADGCDLMPCDCLNFDEAKGKITAQDGNGETIAEYSIAWSFTRD